MPGMILLASFKALRACVESLRSYRYHFRAPA
jgi:hypothetical protein